VRERGSHVRWGRFQATVPRRRQDCRKDLPARLWYTVRAGRMPPMSDMERGSWPPAFGPAPGSAGCKAPTEALVKYGYAAEGEEAP
jgi:hypothetical protein